MERLPLAAIPLGPVFPQLADHQLAHGVVQILRIIGAARRLLPGIAFVLETFIAEQIIALLHRHAARVQANGRKIAAIAQQRVAELADMRFRIEIVQASVVHHLFAIMRPALGKGIADEQLAENAVRPVGVQEIQEMARPYFVDGGEQQVLYAGHIGIARRRVPARVRRGNIIDAGQASFIRPGYIDIGAVLPVIGRRLLDHRLLGAGNGDDVLVDQELAQRGQLTAGLGHRAAFGLVRAHFGDAIRNGRAGRKLFAGRAQGRLVARQIRLADPLQLGQRRVHAFGGQDHLAEICRADGKARFGAGSGADIIAQIPHRGRCPGGGGIELPLQRRILHLGKGGLGIAAIIIGKAPETGLAIFHERLGQWQLQIGLDLRGGGGNIFGIGDERLHPRGRIGIGPRDIHIGIERADIIGRVLCREIRVFDEKQLPLGHMHQIVALEPLLFRQAAQRLGIADRALQKVLLCRDTGGAPVRQQAVKLMFALIDRDIGELVEIAGQEGVAEIGPFALLQRGAGVSRHGTLASGRYGLASAEGQSGGGNGKRGEQTDLGHG